MNSLQKGSYPQRDKIRPENEEKRTTKIEDTSIILSKPVFGFAEKL
jgi:hypothetical protein